MNNYILLLRGINVGGRKVKMDDLKNCLLGIGLQNVRTVLQSGNVIFDSPLSVYVLNEQIDCALKKQFAMDIKFHLLPQDKVKKQLSNYPFKIKDNYHDYLIFIKNDLEKEFIDDLPSLNNNELIASGNAVIYWQVIKGSSLTTAVAKLQTKSKYKDYLTVRNLNTIRKLI